MIKVSAEARCPITFYEELNNMTKSEILKELKMYGVDATLRARKSTLMALLVEKREDNLMDMNVTTEEWMAFTKVDHKLSKSEMALRYCVGFLFVFHSVILAAAFYA